MDKNLITISDASKYLGVTIMTLRRWDKSGRLKPIKTAGNHRRYNINDLNYFIEHKDDVKEIPLKESYNVICYARVSSNDQKEDLLRQVNVLKEYAISKEYNYEIIKDLGSGLNYKKKGLKQLIDKIVNKEIDKIIITYKDRLIRFGYELIEYLCKNNDIEIVILNNNEKHKEQELVEDMLSIVTVFSSRLYGSRSKKSKKIYNDILDLLSKYGFNV